MENDQLSCQLTVLEVAKWSVKEKKCLFYLFAVLFLFAESRKHQYRSLRLKAFTKYINVNVHKCTQLFSTSLNVNVIIDILIIVAVGVKGTLNTTFITWIFLILTYSYILLSKSWNSCYFALIVKPNHLFIFSLLTFNTATAHN